MHPQDDIVVRRLRLLCWTLAGLGILLRLRQFFAARPLWLDEAMVALNVLLRSYRGLLQPLDSDQTAPFPFLWAVKLSAALGGTDERILRLTAILGGVALLLLMVPLAWRLLEPRAAALAVGLTALSPLAIYYSNEIKPYGLDATFMALLAVLTLRVVDHPGSRSAWAALCAGAFLASTAVSPVPFCLTGVGAALLWDRDTRRAGLFLRWFPALVLGSGLIFLTLYLRLYGPVAENAFMQRFWMGFFPGPYPARIRRHAQDGIRHQLPRPLPGRWRRLASHGRPAVPDPPWPRGERHSGQTRNPGHALVHAALARSAGRVHAAPVSVRSAPHAVHRAAADHHGRRRRERRGDLARGALATASVVLCRLRRIGAAAGTGRCPAVPDAVSAGGRGSTHPLAGDGTHARRRHLHPGPDDGRLAVLLDRLERPRYHSGSQAQPPDQLFGRSVLPGSHPGRLHHGRGRRLPLRLPRLGGTGRDFAGDTGPTMRARNVPSPDPGWSANEIRRMFSVDGPELWLVSAMYFPGYLDPLAAPLEAAGARIVERRTATGASITRYQAPKPAPAPSSGP